MTQFFPSQRQNRRQSIPLREKEADARAKAGDYSGAESLVPEYKRRMANLNQMKKVFCLVQDCEKDARAAHDMEMKAVQLQQPRFL
jgi:hypothetical protein